MLDVLLEVMKCNGWNNLFYSRHGNSGFKNSFIIQWHAQSDWYEHCFMCILKTIILYGNT